MEPLKNYKNKKALTLAFLIVGGGFFVIGAVRGEMAVVFVKAVNICLECIGIG